MEIFNNFTELYNAQAATGLSIFNDFQDEWNAEYKNTFDGLQCQIADKRNNKYGIDVSYSITLSDKVSEIKNIVLKRMGEQTFKSEFPSLRWLLNPALPRFYYNIRICTRDAIISPNNKEVLIPVVFSHFGREGGKSKKSYITIPNTTNQDMFSSVDFGSLKEQQLIDQCCELASQIGVTDNILNELEYCQNDIDNLCNTYKNSGITVTAPDQYHIRSNSPLIPSTEAMGWAEDQSSSIPEYDLSFID